MHLHHPLPRWLAENKTFMMNLVHFYFWFFNFVKIGVVLGRMRAYVGVAWGPRTLPNLPMELICSEYVLVWVREQNRAFIFDFWEICDFSRVGSHFSLFSVTLRSVWATFSRWCYSWGHPGTPIWTPRSMNDLSTANSLQPAQSESFGEIRDTSTVTSTRAPTRKVDMI